MVDKRVGQSEKSPKRRYDDVKAASAAAADRIAQATNSLICAFRSSCGPDQGRPRHAELKLVSK